MNFYQIQLSKDQYEKRRLHNKYLRKLKRVKELIINDKCRQITKNEQLKLNILFEFKY